MNARIWGIIGGVALVLALLSPLVLGSAQKVEMLFEAAEALYERSDYENAILKYKEALKESRKFGAKTERIDPDFMTLANLKIARCYYELAENTNDVRHYQSALRHVEEVVLDAQVVEHKEELTYLWAEILYKTGNFNEAESKFSRLIEQFPNSQWFPKALYAMGDINYQQENCEEALSAFRKLVTEFPHSDFRREAELRIAKLNPLCGELDPPNPITQCETMYNAALDLQRQDRIYDAYQLYTNLIAQFPECEYVTDAYVGKAEIHLEAENYVKAREYYEAAMYSTDDRERTTEIYKKYQLTYLVPDYENPPKPHSSSDELFVQARLLREEERWLETAEIYEQLSNRNLSAEDTVYALYWAGYCYHKEALQNATSADATLFRKSVDAFKKLITNHEDSSYNIKAYYYLALAYTDWAKVSGDLSKYQSVIDAVEEVNMKYVDADSNDPSVQGRLSRMQELKGEARKELSPPPDLLREEAEHAVNDAERAINSAMEEHRNPSLIHIADEHLEQAKQQMHTENYRTALNNAKKVHEILDQISLIELYVNEAYIHLRRSELEEATKKAEQALEIDTDYQRAHELLSSIKERHYGRGWTFFDEEQYEKAIAAFTNAINIDSDFKEAYCHLGVIYIEQQRYTKALAVLKKAVQIDPRFKEAHFNLALAYLKLGEFEFARNVANTALEIDPNYEPARVLVEFIAD